MKRIKRLSAILLTMAMLLARVLLLSSCGQSAQQSGTANPAPSSQPSVESVETSGAETEASGADAKILIAYFAVAENSDVDAISSASAA